MLHRPRFFPRPVSRPWSAHLCMASVADPDQFPRQILSKDTLSERVWGYDDSSEYNNLEVYVSFLRKKLGFIGSTIRIRVTRGMGYSLEEGK